MAISSTTSARSGRVLVSRRQRAESRLFVARLSRHRPHWWILTPLYVGGMSTLIAPATFLRRPQRWLELMSANQATIVVLRTSAMNWSSRKTTAVERAALDLSHWRVAFCGAANQSDDVRRVRECVRQCWLQAGRFYPCYGLAEATSWSRAASCPRAHEYSESIARRCKIAV